MGECAVRRGSQNKKMYGVRRLGISGTLKLRLKREKGGEPSRTVPGQLKGVKESDGLMMK